MRGPVTMRRSITFTWPRMNGKDLKRHSRCFVSLRIGQEFPQMMSRRSEMSSLMNCGNQRRRPADKWMNTSRSSRNERTNAQTKTLQRFSTFFCFCQCTFACGCRKRTTKSISMTCQGAPERKSANGPPTRNIAGKHTLIRGLRLIWL